MNEGMSNLLHSRLPVSTHAGAVSRLIHASDDVTTQSLPFWFSISLSVLPKYFHQLFNLLAAVLCIAALDRIAERGLDVLFQDDLTNFVACSRRSRFLSFFFFV